LASRVGCGNIKMNNNPSNPYQIYNPETVTTLRMLGDLRDRRFVAGLSGNASGPQIVKALEEEIIRLRKEGTNKVTLETTVTKPEAVEVTKPIVNPVIPSGFKL
jgi:hypothetical protein